MKLSRLQKMSIINELEAEDNISSAAELLEHRIKENQADNPSLARELLELVWDELCVWTVDGDPVMINYVSYILDDLPWIIETKMQDNRDDFLEQILVTSRIIYHPSENVNSSLEVQKRTRKIYRVLFPVFRVLWDILEDEKISIKDPLRKVTQKELACLLYCDGIPKKYWIGEAAEDATHSNVSWQEILKDYSQKYGCKWDSNGRRIADLYTYIRKGEYYLKVYRNNRNKNDLTEFLRRWDEELLGKIRHLLTEEGRKKYESMLEAIHDADIMA